MKSYDIIIKYNLDIVIYNNQLLDLYSQKQPINAHLGFNTGMNRYGFNQIELENVVKKFEKPTYTSIQFVILHHRKKSYRKFHT